MSLALSLPPTHIEKNGTHISNPDYEFRECQDQLILAAIIASVSFSVMNTITDAKTSAEAWNKLQVALANKLATRILSLREKLSRTKRDSRPVAEYLQLVKSIAEELSLCGSPIDPNFDPTPVTANHVRKANSSRPSYHQWQVLHSKMKHLEIDVHFVQDLVHRGDLCVSHISLKHQLADLLTKPLSKQQFILNPRLASKMDPQSYGGVLRLLLLQASNPNMIKDND
ncbi:hypothetical protein GH714_025991 [Hevea brasiliensis]|uniref:Retrotransposon Copia-like N-terminal domain-containing protein n=1 Tax=Hevea brasiliensis TaxID=3981 RepID=A0A6A6KTU9_HEVBR|nr:hypothetical protein GH714_025991 [Hevea brasiliensis]